LQSVSYNEATIKESAQLVSWLGLTSQRNEQHNQRLQGRLRLLYQKWPARHQPLCSDVLPITEADLQSITTMLKLSPVIMPQLHWQRGMFLRTTRTKNANELSMAMLALVVHMISDDSRFHLVDRVDSQCQYGS
jgi:hypothetical protein